MRCSRSSSVECGCGWRYAALAFASVTLHRSCTMQTHDTPLGVVPALAGSASTLTALHGLSLVDLHDSPALGLALAPAF